MNKRQKEVAQATLDNEKEVLKKLEDNYIKALAEIKKNIRELQAMPDTQSKAYRIEFQKQLEKQISAYLEVLKGNNFKTINEYFQKCYEEGFIGSVYNLQGFGEGVTIPIDQEAAIKAVQTVCDDIKLSTRLDGDTNQLKKNVISELQRGFSTGMMYADIARNISALGQSSMKRAMGIARTEGGRIQCEADLDCAYRARQMGCDTVKQWNAVLDGKTRESHRLVDKEWRELEEPFSNGLMYPKEPGAPASERCNCRCILDDVPRWYVEKGGGRYRRDNETGEIIECKNYAEFKEKYLNDPDRVRKVRAEKAASSVDREQFRRYNEVLKGIAPDNLQDFYEMKYATPDVWKDLQKKYRIVNQYKIDSGHLTPKQILEFDRRVITEKRTQFASDYRVSGNVAAVQIGKNKDKMLIAHSAIHTSDKFSKYRGKWQIVGLSEKRQFEYIPVPVTIGKKAGQMRTTTFLDTEAKLFEQLAKMYEEHPFEEITMLSERGMCDSCKGVMRQFVEKYGVKVNAVSNKKVEGAVWGKRMRKKN